MSEPLVDILLIENNPRNLDGHLQFITRDP
jgi:hypothetical protein